VTVEIAAEQELVMAAENNLIYGPIIRKPALERVYFPKGNKG
jgi:hypothetical protein